MAWESREISGVGAGVVLLAAAASAQDHWQPAWPAPGGSVTLNCYDPHRGAVLVLDWRGDTWEWDGRGWSRLAAGAARPPTGRTLVYDEDRRVFVCPGGGHAMIDDPHPAAEWREFDGREWRISTAPLEPPIVVPYPRTGSAVAYVPGEGVEMYGGFYNFRGSPSGYVVFDDDWGYTPDGWTEFQRGQPGRRAGSQLAFDYGRGVMMLSGGVNDLGGRWWYDLWERRRGEEWRRVAEGVSVPSSLAWDASRGAMVGYQTDQRTALVNGVWTPEAVDPPPANRQHWGVACDGGRGVRLLYQEVEPFNGSINLARPAVVELRGSRWVQVGTNPPMGRVGAEMVYDEGRGEMVLFGGISGGSGDGRLIPDPAVWTLRGGEWLRHDVPGPTQVMNTGMCYDSRRGVTVLACGRVPPQDTQYFGETWEWDGTSWAVRSTTGPGERARHAMAYDRRRGVSVLFGGRNARTPSTYFTETWEWDGDRWTSRAIPGPGGRIRHRMVFDEARGVIVLFGGAAPDGTLLADTWEYDGNAWARRAVSGPTPRALHQMVYDSARGVTLLWGGGTGSQGLLDCWEWNGNGWRQRSDLRLAVASWGAAAAYDRAAHRTVSFGGSGDPTFIIGTIPLVMSILGPDCLEPVITRQPVAATTGNRGTVRLFVEVSGGEGGSFAYQWRRGWPPAVIPGAEGPELTVEGVTLAQGGRYDCIIMSEGECFRRRVVSEPAVVTVCVADYDGDGVVDGFDYAAYIEGYESGALEADVNGDGFLDFFDHDAFVEQFEAGC